MLATTSSKSKPQFGLGRWGQATNDEAAALGLVEPGEDSSSRGDDTAVVRGEFQLAELGDSYEIAPNEVELLIPTVGGAFEGSVEVATRIDIDRFFATLADDAQPSDD